jgi:hypothetical protein
MRSNIVRDRIRLRGELAERLSRYLDWLEHSQYPLGLPPRELECGERLIDAFDAICVLLPKRELDRLVSLLDQMDLHARIVPSGYAVRLNALTDADFFALASWSVAAVLSDAEASLEQMTKQWWSCLETLAVNRSADVSATDPI